MRSGIAIVLSFVLAMTGWSQTDALAKANELLNAKDYKGAEQAFLEATQKDAANELAWFGLGQALQEQGNAQAALEAFNKVQKPSPNLAPRLAFRQGRAYAKLGQTDQA